MVGTFGQKLVAAGVKGTDSLWSELDLSWLDRPMPANLQGEPGGFTRALFLRAGDRVNVVIMNGKFSETGTFDDVGHIGRFKQFPCYDDLRRSIITSLFQVLSALAIIPWEILPRGKYPWEVINHRGGQKGQGPAIPDPERFNFFESLNPDFHVIGKGGFEGYVGFGFYAKRGVVFLEKMETGNAIYAFTLVDGLVGLIKLTKAEILHSNFAAFKGRIIHSGDWKERVRARLAA